MKNIGLMIKRKIDNSYTRYEQDYFVELPRIGEYINIDFNNISHTFKIVALIHPTNGFELNPEIEVYANEVGVTTDFLNSLKSI